MSNIGSEKSPDGDMMRMVVEIVTAYVGQNSVSAPQIPELLRSVYGALAHLDQPAAAVQAEAQRPAVPIKRSVTPDYIVCLEDGRKLKMLKRHLRTTYNMTPDEYRAKWNLGADYPMVAPNYAQTRSDFAKKIGLGRKAAVKAPARRGRPVGSKKAEAPAS